MTDRFGTERGTAISAAGGRSSGPRWRRWLRRLVALALGLSVAVGVAQCIKPMPPGTHVEGPWRPVRPGELDFLADVTYAKGEVLEQEIFDRLFELIETAETFLVLDFFLINDFAGDPESVHRRLSGELIDRLVARRQRSPELPILLITDPINEVYGSEGHHGLETLRRNDIDVVLTDLGDLRDSNPLYSSVYRWAFSWLGNDRGGGFVPNPFEPGDETTVRSYLHMLNFKANHRKVAVAGRFELPPVGLVTSANPHDASSRHSNVGLVFFGEAVLDQLASELAIARSSGWDPAQGRFRAQWAALPTPPETDTGAAAGTRMRVVTEGAVVRSLLEAINSTRRGDSIDMAMFYLAHRGVVNALEAAAQRGARVRLILDSNRDAFGREKNGVPNRPVAAELVDDGDLEVRWYDTHGEQFHTKATIVRAGDEVLVSLGSSNLTRRNVSDYNLEANVEVRGQRGGFFDLEVTAWFERLWTNDSAASYTLDYSEFEDDSWWAATRYRFMEATGLSTF